MVLQASSENLQASADPAGYLQASARGTVLPHPDKRDHYWVRGSETVYLVDAGSYLRRRLPSCECLSGQYRHHCYHLDAVSRYLRELPLCPVCHGRGLKQVPVINILTDKSRLEAWPCVECLGQGSREAYLDVQALKREWDQRHAEVRR